MKNVGSQVRNLRPVKNDHFGQELARRTSNLLSVFFGEDLDSFLCSSEILKLDPVEARIRFGLIFVLF